MLFAFGSNGSGQLGVGHTDDTSKPEPSHAVNPGDDKIDAIVAGGNHTSILFANGFCKGFGIEGHTLFENDGSHGLFSKASTTWSASFYVNQDGLVLCRGEGSNGELGCGKDVLLSKDFVYNISLDCRVVHITSSMAHTVAVLENGQVWGWGNGRKGQLGQPSSIVWTPRKIEGIGFHAVNSICGKDFTCIIGKQDELLILGLDKNDRFGIKRDAPDRVPPHTIAIAASWGSIYMLKEDGELLAWGRNDHGQLPPPNLPPIRAIAAGSEHCLALTKAGQVLAWGWGEHGNCGQPVDENGDVKNRWNEIEVDGCVSKIFAGCATSFIIAQDECKIDSSRLDMD
ncbi:Hypothetical protein R9X50_00565000 [Acrodontium crateriforme]|uniref:RCC1-like domain-containing protein n=1 Tax=Acrodontium crateriforme TaxID=150365 RepID=A0AAQ3M870_9PEZI|nr:Hypothetical protein R9X50_00565000 [Acrodontium crateriforme]